MLSLNNMPNIDIYSIHIDSLVDKPLSCNNFSVFQINISSIKAHFNLLTILVCFYQYSSMSIDKSKPKICWNLKTWITPGIRLSNIAILNIERDD